MNPRIVNMNRTLALREELVEEQFSKRAERQEVDEIIKAIFLFFDDEAWDKFVDAGPDDNAAFLQYMKDEWQRIAVEFEIKEVVE